MSAYTPPRAQIIIERILVGILGSMCGVGIAIAVMYLALYHVK